VIAQALYRHRRLIYLATVALATLGGLALENLASGIYPDVAFPRITVIADAGEDSVENIELGVTRPLEQAVSVVQGVRRVRAKTLRGACEMNIDFEPSVDMPSALQEVRTRCGQIQGQLPPDVHLTIERQTPSIFPVISFHVTLDKANPSPRFADTADLNDWALLELKPRLARLRDVFLVGVQAADVHVVLVEADAGALAARGLEIKDLSQAVGNANKVGVVGRLDRDGKRFEVLVTGQLRSLEELRSVAVPLGKGKVVRLGELAAVRVGVADRTSVITGDGKDAVVVNVFMRSGGRVTELSKGVTEILADMRLPGLLLTPVYDQADIVNASLQGVRDGIVIGAIFCVVVLLFFLRDWRATLIAAPSIPLAILGTFACMPLLGITLNLMSLGGIAIAIGLVVDDAIVVIECIARHRALGESRLEAVDKAVREVAGAVIWSSLTTIAVHAPLALLDGVVGQFMKALSVTIVLAILFSLLISLTLMPVLALGPLGAKDHTGEEAGKGLADLYGRVAVWMLSHKAASWALLLVVLVGVGAFAFPGFDFLPKMDEGSFVLDYTATVGTALKETDARVRVLEAAMLDSSVAPEVRSFSRRTGQELGLFATEAWKGDLLVSLKPRSQRTVTTDELIDRLRDNLKKQVPQLDIELKQLMQDNLNDLMGEEFKIEVKIFGRDHRLLADAITRARMRLLAVDGLAELSKGAAFGSPEIFYRVSSALAARKGVTADDVESGARAALLGLEATRLRQGDRLVPVLVRWPDSMRDDVRWMDALPLEKDGKTFPISVVSDREEHSNPNELTRENQQPVAILTMNTEKVDLGTAFAAVKKALAGLEQELPKGERIEYGGQIISAEAMNDSLVVVLVLGTFLVVACLVAQFRSFARALVILLALPFSQVGGLVALRICGLPLNMSSFMGLIMLVGLVVKNGILLVDYAERLRDEGLPLEEALVRAGRVRLRPILMTSLTAIMGLLPLALKLGAGAELQQPLAIAVIGGLSLSTVFTLAVVPLAMMLLARKPLPVEEVVS
jgi:CzcA family heavy metal efflux pump